MKYLESEIHGEESRIQDCLGFFYMGQTFSCQDRDVVNTFYLFVHLLFNLFKFNKQLFSNTVTFLTKVGLFLPSTRSYVLSISLFERSSPKGTSTFPRTLRNKGGKCCVLWKEHNFKYIVQFIKEPSPSSKTLTFKEAKCKYQWLHN